MGFASVVVSLIRCSCHRCCHDGGRRQLGAAGGANAAQQAGPGGFPRTRPQYIRRSHPSSWPHLRAGSVRRSACRAGSGERACPVGSANHPGGNVAPDTLVFTLASCRRLGVERPFSRLEIFDGVGHIPQLEAPVGFAMSLERFLEQTGPARLDAREWRARFQTITDEWWRARTSRRAGGWPNAIQGADRT